MKNKWYCKLLLFSHLKSKSVNFSMARKNPTICNLKRKKNQIVLWFKNRIKNIPCSLRQTSISVKNNSERKKENVVNSGYLGNFLIALAMYQK